jgi:hypothetical protein
MNQSPAEYARMARSLESEIGDVTTGSGPPLRDVQIALDTLSETTGWWVRSLSALVDRARDEGKITPDRCRDIQDAIYGVRSYRT